MIELYTRNTDKKYCVNAFVNLLIILRSVQTVDFGGLLVIIKSHSVYICVGQLLAMTILFMNFCFLFVLMTNVFAVYAQFSTSWFGDIWL